MSTKKKAAKAAAVAAQPAVAATAKAAAPKTAPKSRRVFPVGMCHQRDAKGNPSCVKDIVGKRANLCPEHEKIWQKAARARYAARQAAASATAAVTATPPEQLEETLKASVAAFATPELAAQARAQRAASH